MYVAPLIGPPARSPAAAVRRCRRRSPLAPRPCLALLSAALAVAAAPGSAAPPAGRRFTLADIEPDGEREVFGEVAPPTPLGGPGPSPSGPAPATPPREGRAPPGPGATSPQRAEAPVESVPVRPEDGLRVVASSTLCERGATTCHAAERLVDGDPRTAWCEGVKGPGPGEWVEVRLGRPRRVTMVGFIPGYAKSHATWFNNARARAVELQIDDFASRTDIPDDPKTFAPGVDPPFPVTVFDFTIDGARPPRLERFRLVVREVHPGRTAADLCLSELTVFALAE